MKPDNTSEFVPEDYPTLEISYDYLKGVLAQQGQILNSLGTKASFIWAAATAVAGIVGPVGILEKEAGVFIKGDLLPLALAITSYIIATALTGYVVYPRRFRDVVDPEKIFKQFLSLSESRFQVDMITHIRKASSHNMKTLGVFGWAVRCLMLTVAAELVLLAWWVLTI